LGEKRDSAHFDVNLVLLSVAMNLDGTIFLLFVESTKLAFLLPVVDGSNENDDEDSDDDGHTFDKIDLGFRALLCSIGRARDGFVDTDVLVQSKSERYHGGDAE